MYVKKEKLKKLGWLYMFLKG